MLRQKYCTITHISCVRLWRPRCFVFYFHDNRPVVSKYATYVKVLKREQDRFYSARGGMYQVFAVNSQLKSCYRVRSAEMLNRVEEK
jgi:hypothetical protein